MISKEEVLVALKALYPDGIPDACGTVMAHEDAPFKSYQELRKILGRTSAWGNRRNWKHLLDGVDSVEPEPEPEPEPELKATVAVTPKTIAKGENSTVKITSTVGTFTGSRVTADSANASKVKITPSGSVVGEHKVEALVDAATDTTVTLTSYARDTKTGIEVNLGNQSLVIKAAVPPVEE